jgi:hypothetical protein
VIVPGGYKSFPVFGSVKFTFARGTIVGFGLKSDEVRTHTVVLVAVGTDKGRGCWRVSRRMMRLNILPFAAPDG